MALFSHDAESRRELVENSFLGPRPRVSNSVHLGGSPKGRIYTAPLVIMIPGYNGEAQTWGTTAQVLLLLTMAIANVHIVPSVLSTTCVLIPLIPTTTL